VDLHMAPNYIHVGVVYRKKNPLSRVRPWENSNCFDILCN